MTKEITDQDWAEQQAKFRETWPSGPWDNEPDRIHWVDKETGYDCLIKRNGSMGNLCGYVGVPKSHPWHGQAPGYDADTDEETGPDVLVHGGITFSEGCVGTPPNGICHTDAEAAHKDVWWLGFDCAHYLDLSPGMLAADNLTGIRTSGRGTYRNVPYVTEQCTSLAKQIAAAA